jgi:nucleoside-diphosphate-sugar epimerase
VAAGHEVVGLNRREDFASPPALADVIRDAAPDVVAHFAGTASVAESFAAPLADFEGSTALWLRLLEAVRLSGLRPRVALASSAAVYGSPQQLPTPETAPRQPESPYGFHKMLSEQAGEEFAKCFGLPVMSLRFFSVFGPRQRRLLVWELFDQLRRNERALRLKGTGDECRDFLPAWEAAAAVVAACPAIPEGFSAINIASGVSTTAREVAEALRACAGSDAEIVSGREALRGNPDRWQADISQLQKLAPDWSAQLFAKSLAMCVQAWNGDAVEQRPAADAR